MKIIGIILLVLASLIFRRGLKFKDTSDKLNKIQMIVGAIMLFVFGAMFLLTKKEFCEVFVSLCK